MATGVTVLPIASGRAQALAWDLIDGETGDAGESGGFTDRSVQVSGTLGGGTITIEGSNDGTNWATLTDPQGNALEIAAAGIKAVSEATLYIRPKETGGTSVTANITVFQRGHFYG